MAAFLGVQSKRIGEAPVLDVLERCLFRLAEKNSILPKLWIVHVAFFGSYIEISAKQNRRIRIAVLIEKLAQALHPSQLELIFIRPNHLAVRNIDIDD